MTARASGAARRAGWALYALAWVLAPLLWPGSAALTALTQIGIAVMACLAFHLLHGRGGMPGFGHAVFVGAGAYATLHLLRAANDGHALALAVPVSLMPLAGGLAGVAAGAVVGLFASHRGGTTFAMITFGLGECVAAFAWMVPGWFGGEGGLSANRVVGAPVLGLSYGPAAQVYGLVAAYAVASTLGLWALQHTPFGQALQAVRDDPERASFLGHSPRALRWQALALAGGVAGVAGGLSALHLELVSAEVFAAARSSAYLVFVVIGGSTLFAGPLVGAVLMVLGLQALSALTGAWWLYLGLLFVVTVLVAPQGLAGLALDAWRARRAHGGAPPGRRAGRAGAAVLAALGAAALIELAHHRHVDSGLGAEVPFMGLLLDGASPWPWAGAAAGVIGGLLAWRRLGRGR